MRFHSSLAALTALVLAAPTLAASVPAKGFPAPGLASAHWRILAVDDEVATLFTDAGLSRSKGIGRGWFTKAYFEPKEFPGTKLGNVKYIQELLQADCGAGTFRQLQLDIYDQNMRLIAEGPVPDDKPERPESGSVGDTEVRLICGLKVSGPSADVGLLNIDGMWPRYMTWLHERQMNAGRR